MLSLTPYDKSTRGLPLSGEDIKELLKDPNSWVSQLYADCKRDAAIQEDFFIQMVIRIAEEERKEKELAADQKAKMAAEEHESFSVSTDVSLASKENVGGDQSSLRATLNALLAIFQAGMTAFQLAQHHQNIAMNIQQQLAVNLGPAIRLTNGTVLQIPRVLQTPVVLIPQVLSHNPVLATQLTDPAMQNAFVNVHTKAELGPLAVFKKYREVLEANNVSDDLDFPYKKELMKLIDSAMNKVVTEFKDLIPHLTENNSLATKLWFNSQKTSREVAQSASLAQSPALYGATPTLKLTHGKKVRKLDEEEEHTKMPKAKKQKKH